MRLLGHQRAPAGLVARADDNLIAALVEIRTYSGSADEGQCPCAGVV
jgi:hypothetical protein